MKDRICLITGATSGLGKATAIALAHLGANVIVHGRNPQKCTDTVAAIKEVTGSVAIEPLVADLSSLKEVRRMAEEFKSRWPQLHVLVNNAGLSLARRRLSTDGYELMFAVNHLAHFLLTNLLLDRLIASAPARVVVVSSGLHRQAKLDFENLQAERKFSSFGTYGVSKLANIMFTYEMARRLTGKGVTVNAMNPGMVATNIGMDEGGIFAASKKIMDRIMGKTPEQGADTIVYLASSPEVEGITGKCFENRKAVLTSPTSCDEALQARLWQVSEELTGCDRTDSERFAPVNGLSQRRSACARTPFPITGTESR